MSRALHRAALAAGLWAAWAAHAGAAGPLGGAEEAAPARPPLHIDVVARNLWDVWWNNPPRRPLTGESRLGWDWLARQCGRDAGGAVAREDFPGKEGLFTRLDRNWDGKLTREDFAWGGGAVLGLQKSTTFALFKVIDRSSDGRITPEEWEAAFNKTAGEKGYLSDQDLEELIFRPRVTKALRERRFFEPSRQPAWTRLERLLAGGRLFSDGPRPGEEAPDFVLRTPDGKGAVRLSSYRGKRPVVLIFGSFT